MVGDLSEVDDRILIRPSLRCTSRTTSDDATASPTLRGGIRPTRDVNVCPRNRGGRSKPPSHPVTDPVRKHTVGLTRSRHNLMNLDWSAAISRRRSPAREKCDVTLSRSPHLRSFDPETVLDCPPSIRR